MHHVRAAPLGNLAAFDVGGRVLERVNIASDDLARRVVRLETSVGAIGIRLEGESRLRHDDVVYADERCVIALAVLAEDVLVLRPQSIAEALALALAHALGNRHVPVQLEDATLVLRYDALVAELFVEHGAAFTREARRLARPFRHANAPHSH